MQQVANIVKLVQGSLYLRLVNLLGKIGYILPVGFVCKMFDTFSMPSIKLLYFICCFYDEVYLNKPLTSRPANSEKYIIAKNFKGVNQNYLNFMQIMKKQSINIKIE